MAVNGIELQVGQVWRNRARGLVRLIDNKGRDTDYPWVGDNEMTYTSEGVWYIGETDIDDLITPISGPGIDPEPVPALPVSDERIKFQVGQYWERRDGTVVRIKRKAENLTYPWISSEGLSYTDFGEHEEGRSNDADLVTPRAGPGIGKAPCEPQLVPPAQPHPHYFIPVPAGITQLDVYRLCLMAGVTDPCAQHILKKVLRPGQRGAKTERQDWENIRDTAVRRLAMMDEDGTV